MDPRSGLPQNKSQWHPPETTDREKLNILLADKEMLAKYLEETKAPSPKKIRCAHLLVKHEGSRRPIAWDQPVTRTKAKAFQEISSYEDLIRQGKTTLEKLASTKSDCSSAAKEGDLGFFGPGMMQKPFEDAAFELKVGEMSSVVETASGLHLIKRLA